MSLPVWHPDKYAPDVIGYQACEKAGSSNPLHLAADRHRRNGSDTGRSKGFGTHCTICHGGDANGTDRAPAILSFVITHSDAELSALVRTGRPDKGMPRFDFNDAEMQALTAHLRGLAAGTVQASGGSGRSRGAIFQPHPATLKLQNGGTLAQRDAHQPDNLHGDTADARCQVPSAFARRRYLYRASPRAETRLDRLRRQLLRQPLQFTRTDQYDQRAASGARLGFPGDRRAAAGGHSGCDGRRHVHHRT